MSERDPLLADREAQQSERYEAFVKPRGDALSVFFFLVPLIKRRKEDSGSYRHSMVAFSFFLVVFSLLMQLTLLYVVGNAMVEEKETWMTDLVTVHTHFSEVVKFDALSAAKIAQERECHAKYSLCFADYGMITCAPKTIQLMGRWSNIDLNGDGLFSYDEAAHPEFRNKMKCRYGVDTLIFFQFLIQELTKAEILQKDGLLHSNVTTGHAVHKSYFDWLKGDAILCSYGADDICGNIFQVGAFDAPLKHAGVSRLINDADSAAAYCRNLLREEGRCEQMLPSTYRVWRNQQQGQCGHPEFTAYVYTNPRNPEDVVSLTSVEYALEKEYNQTKSWYFAVFLTVILITFLANSMNDLRQAMRFGLWVAYFPERALPGESGFVQTDEDEDTLTGVSANHRRLCTVILLIHIIMTILVAYVGIVFLTSSVSYKDLLFDALSLALITQMDMLVYEMMVRSQAKEELESIKSMSVALPINFVGNLYMRIIPPARDFLWAVVLILFAAILVWEDYQTRLIPVRQALNCACTTQGEHCFEAQLYNREFWDHYWMVEIPQAYSTIEHFMGKSSGTAPALAAAPTAVAAIAAPTVKHKLVKMLNSKKHA